MSTPIFLNDNLPAPDTQRGISRYFDKLKAALATEFPGQVALCTASATGHRQMKVIPSIRFKGSYRLRLQDRIATLAARYESPRVFYSPYFGVARTGASEIFSVYDMIPEKIWLPEHNNRINRKFVLERQRCLVRAAAILAISENTASDLKTLYPNLGHKVVVTLLGVDNLFFEPPATLRTPADKPYFLYVGNRTIYKNFGSLLAAYGQSGLARDFDLRVISPGMEDFSAGETALIQKWRLEEKVKLFRAVNNEKLRESYAGAAAFVYPSRYEGFGLPVLEAMASGTLVATSQGSSLPEVGGEVAFYFNPDRLESIVASLKQIARLPEEERQKRVAGGIARARTFTWEKFQQETAAVFKQFL